jgi:hypothetical protein
MVFIYCLLLKPPQKAALGRAASASPMPRFSKATVPAALIGCCAIPAPILHQALAATAGTLFEAAPFVLAVSVVRGPLVRWTAALLGCGCGPGAGYAALSLPAAALCWTVFGPLPALARFGAAALLQGLAGRSHPRCHPRQTPASDPLEQLGIVAVAAFALALSMSALSSVAAASPAHLTARLVPLVPLAEGLAGLVAGALAPCATAAVAMAAMLRLSAPLAAAGILATAGLVRWQRPARTCLSAPYGARIGLILLGLACAALALRNGSGFVHPRLVPLLWLAVPAAGAAWFAQPTTHVRFGAAAPAAMLAALVLGSPVPASLLGSSTLDDLYPGEPIAFTGVVNGAAGPTTLVRFAITCCRADATAIALPTNLHLRLGRDTWLEVSGTIARGAAGTYLRAERWRRVAAPADPYVYR